VIPQKSGKWYFLSSNGSQDRAGSCGKRNPLEREPYPSIRVCPASKLSTGFRCTSDSGNPGTDLGFDPFTKLDKNVWQGNFIKGE